MASQILYHMAIYVEDYKPFYAYWAGKSCQKDKKVWLTIMILHNKYTRNKVYAPSNISQILIEKVMDKKEMCFLVVLTITYGRVLRK